MTMSSDGYHISSLEIKNFRQYREAQISFSHDPEKMFTVIRGANGAGKTNIMNAITWCLYGTEKHLGSDERDMPIVNTNALSEKPDGLVVMSVKIKLADREGDKYTIMRQIALYNDGQTDLTEYDNDTKMVIPSRSTPVVTKTFQYYDEDDGGWKTTDFFDTSVQKLLPEDLALYFLFDGEELEDFFEYNDKTKKGIEDVSQIKTAEQAIATLSKLITQKRRDSRNLDPNVDECIQQLENAEESVDKLKEKIKNIDSEIRQNSRRIDEIDRSIIGTGGDVGQYQKELKTVETQIRGLVTKRKDAESKKTNHVVEHMFDTQLLANIGRTVGSIRAKTMDGTLPPKIRDTFLKELLEIGRCICGNDISSGLPSRDNVQRLFESAKYSAISNICTELKHELSPILVTDDTLKALDDADKEILFYQEEIKQRKYQREELKLKIHNAADESVSNLNNEKSGLVKHNAELNQNRGSYAHQKEDADKLCSSLRLEYKQETRKDIKYKHTREELDFCTAAQQALGEIINKLLDDVRDTVQNHTKDYFLQFLWKKDTYNDVTIDDDYRITAHHVGGYDVRMGLSKGEKLILALSFMAALRKITGFGFPLLIDTPLGRVSGEPRYNIARLLPKFLSGGQVTLLVTDSEYQARIQDDDNKQTFPPIRETINEHVGADYDIVFEGNESKVVKH